MSGCLCVQLLQVHELTRAATTLADNVKFHAILHLFYPIVFISLPGIDRTGVKVNVIGEVVPKLVNNITLVNVYVDSVLFTRIAGTS